MGSVSGTWTVGVGDLRGLSNLNESSMHLDVKIKMLCMLRLRESRMDL